MITRAAGMKFSSDDHRTWRLWGHSWGHRLSGACGMLFTIWDLYDLFEGPRHHNNQRLAFGQAVFVSGRGSAKIGFDAPNAVPQVTQGAWIPA